MADDPDMQTKWRYFLKSLGNPDMPFAEVIGGIQQFLTPVWTTILSEGEHIQRWSVATLCWE